jgi:uncharacterized phage infection (PIP) family protein YhgE
VEQGTALVDKAGSTMTEVVASVRRVTDIMAEISAASAEQSAGVGQIGEAVQQMDQATQQNAALVEEMAAAASSLRGQAQDLVQAVAVFKLNAHDAGMPARSAPAQSQSPRKPPVANPVVGKPAATRGMPAPRAAVKPPQLASSGKSDQDWESF